MMNVSLNELGHRENARGSQRLGGRCRSIGALCSICCTVLARVCACACMRGGGGWGIKVSTAAETVFSSLFFVGLEGHRCPFKCLLRL